MEFELHPIGPSVVAGLIYFPLDRFLEAVDHHRKLISGFPDELSTCFFLRLAPAVPVMPKKWVGPVVAIALCHCGDLEDAKRWTHEFASFGKPIVNTVTAIEYRLWQRSLDARWGNGFFNDWRGHYLDELSADAIRILIDHVERLNSPWTDIKIAHLEGAVSRVSESASAYGSRNARFGLVIQARWEHGSDSAAQVAWATGLRDALAPYTAGRVYTNFIAADEIDRVRLAHGPENYRRLRELKSKYDPSNVFHNNANVPPICNERPAILKQCGPTKLEVFGLERLWSRVVTALKGKRQINSNQPSLDSLIGNSFRTLRVEMHAWLHEKIFPYDSLRLFDVISARVRLR
jgi:hypothetical protein